MNIEQMNEQMRLDYHQRGHTGKDIVVHVLDTGMNENRSEFLYSDRGIATSKIIMSPYGRGGGHGEKVAGIILKWLPDARIVNWHVLSNPALISCTEAIVSALTDTLAYVKAHPEKIHMVNMSLSGELNPNTEQVRRYEKAVNDLVMAGCSVFVSAGNDGKEMISKYPSCFESPITVAALNVDGTKADFSTWHNEVDFSEWGVNVPTIFPKQSFFSSGWELFSGTSAACPELLGKAGLIQSEHHDLTGGKLTDAELYERLKGCAEDLGAEGKDPYTGFGIVNLLNRKEGNEMEFEYVTDTGLQWPEGKSKRSVTDALVVHHTVGDYGTPAKWERLHKSRVASLTHKGVSYNYLVCPDGTIMLGRGLEYAGGGVKDSLTNKLNQRCVHVAFNGDLRKGVTQAALASAARLCKDILKTYPGIVVWGHNEVPVFKKNSSEPDMRNGKQKTYATLCPCLDMNMFRGLLTVKEEPKPEPTPEPQTLPADFHYSGGSYVNIRTEPNGKDIGDLRAGEQCIVLAVENGWAEILKPNGNGTYIRGWCVDTWLRRCDV